ncbi:MAG: Type 1 glutamine amidotransferase-like domain-containing protein [Clostridiales bacterium]|nr:Type 1 glutamine amidotransferase-like domain-containing protein [Clostridiales bacterium]
MTKRIIAIGGGEIRNKTTLEIDRVIAGYIKERAYPERGCALFLGTASHDSMPYFNSFRKTYTSVFDIKAEVGLLVYGEMDEANIKSKFDKADCIYVGGGDTKFMLDLWKEKGIDKLLIDAYNRGVILCGLSAGAVCWFKNAYTDYDIMRGESSEYKVLPALGILDGIACPHYDERPEFDEVASGFDLAYAIGNDSAIIFEDGVPTQYIGNAKRKGVTDESGNSKG